MENLGFGAAAAGPGGDTGNPQLADQSIGSDEIIQGLEANIRALNANRQKYSRLLSFYSNAVMDVQMVAARGIIRSMHRQGADVSPNSEIAQTISESIVPPNILAKISANPGPIVATTNALIQHSNGTMAIMKQREEDAQNAFKIQSYKMVLCRSKLIEKMMNVHIEFIKVILDEPEIKLKFIGEYEKLRGMLQGLDVNGFRLAYRELIDKLLEEPSVSAANHQLMIYARAAALAFKK